MSTEESKEMNGMAFDILNKAKETESDITNYRGCINRYRMATYTESKKEAANSTYEAIDELCEKCKELMNLLKRASSYGKKNGGLFIVGLIYADLREKLKSVYIEDAFIQESKQIHMGYIDIAYGDAKTAQGQIQFCNTIDAEVEKLSDAVEEIIKFGSVFRIDCRMAPIYNQTESETFGEEAISACRAAEDLHRETIDCMRVIHTKGNSHYYRVTRLNKLLAKIYMAKSSINSVYDGYCPSGTYKPLLRRIIGEYGAYLDKIVNISVSPFAKSVEADAVDLTDNYIPKGFEEKLEEMRVALRILERLLIELFSLETV